MSLTAKQGPPMEQIENGNHQGVCVAIIDLGTQYNELYKKEQPKIMLIWELTDFPLNDKSGQVVGYQVISKEYTASLGEKANLYGDLVSWRGQDFTEEELQGFQIKKVLGANCLVNVVRNKKDYAQVAAVAKLPKSMPAKKGTYQLLYDMDEGVTPIPEGVPEWIVKKIKASQEYLALESGETNLSGNYSPDQESPPDDGSDLPF